MLTGAERVRHTKRSLSNGPTHLSDVTQGKTAVTGVKAGEASHGDHSSDDGDDVKENRPHNGGGGRLARSRAAAASDTL